MGIVVKEANTQIGIEKCISIRRIVFIEEQNIPEKLELDDSTIKCNYFLAIYNGNYVGTARYRKTKEGIKLERFAVIKKCRGIGIGNALARFILKNIKKKSNVYLHAQEPVVGFYTKLGFKLVGGRFFEADIPHVKLVKI